MSRPIAVLISDVHYNINTLPLADKAMRMAINKANELSVPLIVAGDLHDTKANLRGECVNAMIETFSLLENDAFILRGNHDSINEKSQENALSFLEKRDREVEWDDESYKTNITVINKGARFTNVIACKGNSLWLIPYQHDINQLKIELKKVEKDAVVIMHQGLTGSNMGDYIQDKSAITVNDVAGLRVISGHYHNRQTIDLPDGGTWDYIGNPYTLSFGEANDPPKGFQILYDDGSLEFVPTNLRKHGVITAIMTNNILYTEGAGNVKDGDLVWVKCFDKTPRQVIQDRTGIKEFKLTYEGKTEVKVIQPKNLTQTEILDSIINNLDKSETDKARLTNLWRSLCE